VNSWIGFSFSWFAALPRSDHVIQPPYTITAFNVVTAVTLIVVTSIIGFVMGWLFGAIWNWLHSSE